jgi:hypothetical protein
MEVAQRVDRLEEVLLRLAAAEERTELRLAELAEGQLALAEAQQRTEQRIGELAEGQRTLAESVQTLAEGQRRTEQRIAELTDSVRALVAAQKRTDEQLGMPVSWQTGEHGRRQGERLERKLERGGATTFAGGEGGSGAQRWVQRWLNEMLAPLRLNVAAQLPADEDPALADLLWRKGDKVALVEISWVVDEHDVLRASKRAATLRRAGIDAIPVVLGNAWAAGEVRWVAGVEKVAWRVGTDVSDTYVAYRRLPDPLPSAPTSESD